MRETLLENVLKRDRALIITGLALFTALSWVYTIHLATGMSHAPGSHASMSHASMSHASMSHSSWNLGLWTPVGNMTDFGFLLIMWTVMMIAMMLPSAAQMILVLATVHRKKASEISPLQIASVFLLGYLLAWTAYSALAAGVQWGLHRGGLMSELGVSTSFLISGALLVVAGIFQWTPAKSACLERCRSPLGFLMTEWRPGLRGALIMGLRHGSFCVVCCWALMALMFVVGTMSVLGMVAITVFVLLERVVPGGHRLAHVAGVGFVGWGLWVLSAGWLGA